MDVILREARAEDVEVLFENQSDPDSNAMAGVKPKSREDFFAHRKRVTANPENVLRVIEVGGDEIAGDIVSWRTESGGREIGYRIGQKYWGRGIATAALTAFTAEVTERPLYAHVVHWNPGSMRVLDKCGFERLPADQDPEPDPETQAFVLR